MLFLDLKQEIGKILLLSDNPQNIEVLSEAQWMKAFGLYLSRSNPSLNPNRSKPIIYPVVSYSLSP